MQARPQSAPTVLPLWGRDEELAELGAGLEEALSGRGRLFLVTGGAGIGKTRLVEALVASSEGSNVHAVWGRCWEGGGAPAYWPWVQVVRACLADLPVDALLLRMGPGAAEIVRLAPELSQRVPDLVPASRSDSPGARLRLFDAVTTLLRHTASDGGLVVALEDLHAADEVSLQLLEHLAGDGLRDTHLLVVGTCRDSVAEGSVQLRRRFTNIAQHARQMGLSGLDRAGVTALLGADIGTQAAEEMASRVLEITDGNPFFVQEIARLLSTRPGAGAVPWPGEIYAQIQRRLESVDEPVHQVLFVAAVVGREFELSVLVLVTGGSPESILDALERAQNLHLVRETSVGRWTFVHGLVRETLYAELSSSERRALHRRVGEVLEQRGTDDQGVQEAELAHHFFQAACAEERDKAVRYCTMAGETAMSTLAYEEASLQYGRALEALALSAPVDESRRGELLIALGDSQFRSGHFPEAREAHMRAFKVARLLGAPRLMARAAIAYAGLPAGLLDQTLIDMIEEATATLPPEENALHARLLMASLNANAWRPTDTLARSTKALELARGAGGTEALLDVLLQWHLYNQDPDLHEMRLEVADELIGLATEVGDRERLLFGRLWRANDLFEGGDLPAMGAELEAASKEASELRLPILIWNVAYMRAALALAQARPDDAARLAEEALVAGERTEFPVVEAVFATQVAAVQREQGRFEEMADLSRRCDERYRNTPTNYSGGMLALALAELRHDEAARRELAEVVEHLLRNCPLIGPVLVAETSWLLAEPRWAEETYEALPGKGHHLVHGKGFLSFGSSDRYLAQMAALLERYDEAEARFRAAHARHERIGAPAWLAHGYSDHARMLLRRGRTEDRARADDLLRAAGARFRALGMDVHAARAAELAGRPGGLAERSEAARFVFEGDAWEIQHEGLQARLSDSTGLRCIARLLREPGRTIHAVDLAAAAGSGPFADEERARQNVTRAIRRTVARIADVHPGVGEHLRTTLRTGLQCSYTPDPRAPIVWED